MEKFEKTNYFDVTVVCKICPENHRTGSLMVDEMHFYVGVFILHTFLVFQPVKVDSYVVSQVQEGIRSGLEEMLWFHRVLRRILWRAKHCQQTQWYCLGACRSRHSV